MKNSLSKVTYLLFALMLFALSGCGANSLNTAGSGQPGTLTAKLTMPKSSAKTVGAVVVAAPTKITLKVTGATIPTATKEFTDIAGGSLAVYPGSRLIVTARALDANDNVLYEGFAVNQSVVAGTPTTVAIDMVQPKINPENTPCIACHDNTRDAIGQNLVADFKQSGHYTDAAAGTPSVKNGSNTVGCAGCHGTGHNDVSPSASGRCFECHNSLLALSPQHTGYVATTAPAVVPNNCTDCHNAHNPLGQFLDGSCVKCHAFAQDLTDRGNYVNDNNGVRAITAEFTKWSHHVTGVTLQDAHCAACHLEGKAGDDKKIHIDTTYHMADAKTHLRNADTDADMQWDPAAPNHSTMDNFCMTCHDGNGAASTQSAAIRAIMIPAAGKTASASNPFGDTISNRYDKMQRPAVVDASGQFNTDNNSHHAVKGPRYTGRTRTAGARQIASPATFAANSSATLFGKRMTIYDAVTQDGRAAFNALYVPLANTGGEVAPRTGSLELGDDSTLHCGDCHTVGQWKAGVAVNAAGVLNTDVIGAHGSNNEYLLRNDKGTDARHTQDAYLVGNAAGTVTNPNTGLVIPNGQVQYTNPNAANLVCFNCHSYSRYGSLFSATGTTGPHAGEYDAGGRCNGVGNTIPFNGYTTGTATDGTQFGSRFEGPRTKTGGTPAFAPGFPLPSGPGQVPASGEQDPDFGNVFGIACANCHNSGSGNAYGGIHGSKNNQTLSGYTNKDVTAAKAGSISVVNGTYIDGMGNTTKIMRFLPGLGDAMHVPGTLGGVTGGSTAKFIQYSSDRVAAPNTMFTELPVRDNRPAALAGNKQKVGSYNFTTGGITNDTNWEQKGWKQSGPNSTLDANQQQAVGAGCYTLGSSVAKTPGTISTGVGFKDQNGNVIAQRPNVMDDLRGPSQGVAGEPNPELWENWGGCDDHSAPIGGGNHGFIKRIVRPVTY